ncbi:MAG: hypothetical protein ACYDH8_09705 [Syntrophales bacterium]
MQVKKERLLFAPEPGEPELIEPELIDDDYADQEENQEADQEKESPPVNEPVTPPAPLDIYTFPDGIMAGFADEFAEIYSHHLESAKHFFFFTLLTCLGLLFSDKVRLRSELNQQMRLFLVLLGESADDRKSTAISKATGIVEYFRDIFGDIYTTCNGAGSAEGLLKVFNKTMAKVLLIYDEFAVFISKAGIESSVLLPCVNTLFEQNRYENATSKHPLKLGSGFLSMVAACTVNTWERIWTPTFTAIGFQNRLFLCPGKGRRQFAFPEKIPDQKKEHLRRLFSEIADWVGEGREIGITDEAKKIYETWYLHIERSVHSKRLDVYALRFMLLFCVNEKREIIDTDIVERVIKLMEWQLAVRKVLDPLDCDNKIALMEARIRKCLSPIGTIKTERNMKRACHVTQAGYWQYNSALSNLTDAAEIIALSKKGTKNRKFQLNADNILD